MTIIWTIVEDLHVVDFWYVIELIIGYLYSSAMLCCVIMLILSPAVTSYAIAQYSSETGLFFSEQCESSFFKLDSRIIDDFLEKSLSYTGSPSRIVLHVFFSSLFKLFWKVYCILAHKSPVKRGIQQDILSIMQFLQPQHASKVCCLTFTRDKNTAGDSPVGRGHGNRRIDLIAKNSNLDLILHVWVCMFLFRLACLTGYQCSQWLVENPPDHLLLCSHSEVSLRDWKLRRMSAATDWLSDFRRFSGVQSEAATD